MHYKMRHLSPAVLLLLMAATMDVCGQEVKPPDQPVSVDPMNPRQLLEKDRPAVLIAPKAPTKADSGTGQAPKAHGQRSGEEAAPQSAGDGVYTASVQADSTDQLMGAHEELLADHKAASNFAAAGSFNELSRRVLVAMKEHAAAIGVTGVAVAAYFDGEQIQSWESKMIVVGKRKDPPTATAPGANLLAIAYAKAAEAADSLKPSGSAGRPLMTGEYGWSGSVIRKAKNGYWIAAFSGGKSENDVDISKTGLDSILNTE
jgi:hypothetical protein